MPGSHFFFALFWEDMPGLHVIAAGSLLEFALSEIPTFGVGRIHSMFMYPMSFDEFLNALGMFSLQKYKREASPEKPLLSALHEQLVSLFRTYLMVGGMPESVSTWVDTHSYVECQAVQKEIAYTYEVDLQNIRNVPIPLCCVRPYIVPHTR